MAINSIKHRLTHMGLRQKIWLTIAVVSGITVLITIGLTFYLYEKLYVDKQKELLLLQGSSLKEAYLQEQGQDQFLDLIEWTKKSSEADIIFTENPMELSASLPYGDMDRSTLITFEERQQLLNGETVTMVRQHPVFQQDILAVAIPLLEGEALSGAIFLYMPLEDVYAPFESIRYVLALLLVIILLTVIWAGRKVASQMIQPLKKMELISTRMAAGDFTKRIQVSSSDEIGSLAHSFNRLAGSLEEVENSRREFLQNVSHELRTPLSYMRGYTEAMLEGMTTSGEEREKYLRIIHNETARLTRLVNDLLDLAQLEGESYPMRKEPIPFAQLVMDVTERFKFHAEQKHIHLGLQLDEEVIIEGDADRLEQVISNLLDNAIRYTPEAGEVMMELKQNDHLAVLTVKDTGCGIPEEDLENIMDRFYRVHKPRTRNEGGFGLGLAIVKQIVWKHGGTIDVQSQPGKGTSISLTFHSFSFESQ
ncbi:sensor histidine kinase [Bacillus sp. SG-1]|uniref:sensor histidine kinase n=1 Tax=Bacillus sp. SG-1 TaxID=161544 RepID=UPI001E5404C3|nr:HAMP domain-containing sensor histidine kinase [Bacillus sp. SG-1]